MTTFIEHITLDGERWDQISMRYFGDPFSYEAIILANPHVPIVSVLDADIRLQIPIEDDALITTPADLPPWKRS